MKNPADQMLSINGHVDVSTVMKAAHIKARREMDQFRLSRLYTESDAAYWTYARHFREAIQWAWDRAKQMQRLAVARAA